MGRGAAETGYGRWESVNRHAVSGGVSVEFSLCCLGLAAALLWPWIDGRSAVALLVEAMRDAFRIATLLLSIY